MQKINNVLICGIGAVGSIFADKIQSAGVILKVLVDEGRLQSYRENPPALNGKVLEPDYVLPDAQDYKADLVIIAVKFTALDEVVKNIKNFVGENTIIISLLNGITSEEIIAAEYGWEHILYAYFIGHSAMRVANQMTSGAAVIVFGGEMPDNPNILPLKEFFEKVGIDYKVPDDMKRSLWLKFMLNVAVNQLSAILRMTFGQIVKNEKFMVLTEKIMREVAVVAQAEGIADTVSMPDEALAQLRSVASPDGKTSMLQDVEACRQTEADMFAGTVIELGRKHNIPTPLNQTLRDIISVIEAGYEPQVW